MRRGSSRRFDFPASCNDKNPRFAAGDFCMLATMKFQRIDYRGLNGKQQEIHNFQKVAALLADYGFNCIKLADDWQGADFLAYHHEGRETLKVQLKSRLTIDQKYQGKGLHIAFPLERQWCVVDHDELLRHIERQGDWLETNSWKINRNYHTAKPPLSLRVNFLDQYMLSDPRTVASLMMDAPDPMGLRGDRYLWSEMRSLFATSFLPESPEELDALITRAFLEVTGKAFADEDVFVKRYDKGGMSSGWVSVDFWRNKAIPLMRQRLAEMI
ncbi:MAG: hypothetical protein QM769_14450 [Pseudoxanthomonas sp.]